MRCVDRILAAYRGSAAFVNSVIADESDNGARDAVFLLVRAGGARAAARRKQIFHSRFARRPPHFTETPGQPLGTEINRRLGRPMSSVVPVDLLRIAGRIVQAF